MGAGRTSFDNNTTLLNIPVGRIHIGLKDLDPTRVAKNRRHIHLQYSSSGIVAEMLGLLSAGFKKIICLKYGHAMQGFKLDELYMLFSKNASSAESVGV